MFRFDYSTTPSNMGPGIFQKNCKRGELEQFCFEGGGFYWGRRAKLFVEEGQDFDEFRLFLLC